jgi:nucleoside-diphosphate-sugar epimerase
VAAALAARGRRVGGTTRGEARGAELRALGVEVFPLDLERADESPAWAGPWSAAVYAVAPGRGGDASLVFRHGPPASARRLLHSGTLRRFVFISSTGVYGETGGAWVDEETPPRPAEERLRDLVAGEEALLEMARTQALPCVILRLGGIYGPGRSPRTWLRRPEMRERIAASNPDGWMNWIRVEDAAEAVMLALERGTNGSIYDVVDGEPVRRQDFYALGARLEGLDPPRFAGPADDLGKRVRGEKARRELGFLARHGTYREGLATP